MSERSERMINGAPYYYQYSRVYTAIQEAQGNEYDSVHAKNEELRKQLYIITATWGLKYWEIELKIPVNEADSYEIRRSRVLSKWRGITAQFSVGLIKSICEAFTNGEVEVTNYMKNEFNPEWYYPTTAEAGMNSSGLCKTVVAATHYVARIDADTFEIGAADGNANGWYGGVLVFFNLVPGKTYYLSFDVDVFKVAANMKIFYVPISGPSTNAGAVPTVGKYRNIPVVARADGKLVLRIQSDNTNGRAVFSNIMITADPDADYEPRKAGTIGIKFVGTAGLPPNLDDLKYAVENIVHAHLGIDYIFIYTTWDKLDAQAMPFSTLDTYVWNQLETAFALT